MLLGALDQSLPDPSSMTCIWNGEDPFQADQLKLPRRGRTIPRFEGVLQLSISTFEMLCHSRCIFVEFPGALLGS